MSSARPRIPSEAGDHFVENEKRAVFVAKLLEFVKKLVPRRITARRLQDEGGYATLKAVKQTARTCQIIVAEAKDQILDRLGNARIHFRCPDEPVVGRENGWSLQRAIRSRPVTARASRIAADVASEPFLQNLTISAVWTVSRKVDAQSTSIFEGRVKLQPRYSSARAASTTSA